MAGNDDILLRIGADVSDLKRGLLEARKGLGDTAGVVDQIKDKFLGLAAVFGAGLGVARLIGDALEFADAIQKAADQTGMTAEQVQYLRFAADQTGVSVDSLTSLVSKMQRQLVEASDGNEKVTKALADMGLEIGKLRAMGPDEQFRAIATAIAAIPDPADQAAAATQAFGKAGADALPVIKTFAGEQEHLAEQFAAIGGPVAADTIAAVDNLGDAGHTAGLAVKSLATELLGAVAPAIISGLETVSNILGGIRVVLGDGGNAVVDLSGKILTLKKQLDANEGAFGIALSAEEQAALRAQIAELEKQEQILLKIGVAGSALAVKKHAEAAEELADITVIDQAHLDAIARREAAEESARNKREADRMAELGDQQRWLDAQIAAAEEAQQTQVDLEAPILDEGALYYADSWRDRAGSVADNLKNMTEGVAKENRAMFEINKAASLASAVVNTAQGVTKALAQYPPPLSFVMAAAQAAAGAAQISAISRSQFGGATAPSQATTPATPVAPQGGGNGGGGNNVSTLQVQGVSADQLFTGKTVRSLVTRINEHVRDGGRLEMGQ